MAAHDDGAPMRARARPPPPHLGGLVTPAAMGQKAGESWDSRAGFGHHLQSPESASHALFCWLFE